jgi:hypothetical protein
MTKIKEHRKPKMLHIILLMIFILSSTIDPHTTSGLINIFGNAFLLILQFYFVK